ncbi:hypothetical protein D7D52_35865 [Nocardia yunnanensis]|uniref:Uncharacterized protein n=1 Tax=Nocardia yunnanensis TaxID=2382165 RepID=A0A386ZL27_9NOCA|nr:hypothetical protein D7D52_35865 [Nocardia yunnanensis]
MGALLADATAAFWSAHGEGPTWREAADLPGVKAWWHDLTGMKFLNRAACGVLMRRARSAGWVAFAEAGPPRSLCPGRQFYLRRFGTQISQAERHEIGMRVAAFVGTYCDEHGHSPDWAHIAAAATDTAGIVLFANADDAAEQFRWLQARGWLTQDSDGGVVPGFRAVDEARRRAEFGGDQQRR